MILIITAPKDPHLPLVTKHLYKDEFVVLDVGVVAARERLTYELGKDGSKVLFKEKELTDVTGVWYRRPRMAREHLHLNIRPDYLSYAHGALQKHLNQL